MFHCEFDFECHDNGYSVDDEMVRLSGLEKRHVTYIHLEES